MKSRMMSAKMVVLWTEFGPKIWGWGGGRLMKEGIIIQIADSRCVIQQKLTQHSKAL